MSIRLYAQDIIAAATTEEPATTPQKFTAKDAGVWFDGAAGYGCNARRVIALAGKYGMKDATVKPGEELDFVADDADRFLADLAPAGFWIGWHEGDYGMFPCDAEGEEL